MDRYGYGLSSSGKKGALSAFSTRSRSSGSKDKDVEAPVVSVVEEEVIKIKFEQLVNKFSDGSFLQKICREISFPKNYPTILSRIKRYILRSRALSIPQNLYHLSIRHC